MGRVIDRRRVMGGGKLPYDARIEYLESSGQQWISTGVIYDATNDYEFDYDIFFKRNIYSANGWNGGAFVGMQNNRPYDGVKKVQLDASEKRIHVVQIVRNKNASDTVTDFSVDGSDYVLTRTHPALAYHASNNPYPIFALYSQGLLVNYAHERIYSFKVIINDILIRDLIPVRVGNVGYMYDKVSGKLFGNAGTGEFILGPDVNSGNS